MLALFLFSLTTVDMSSAYNFYISSMILRYCMSMEDTSDVVYGREIAEFCGLFEEGKPTRDGYVLATLMRSDEKVSYEKVKRISARLAEEVKKRESIALN